MRTDFVVEYVAGFAFGLFIFQALFMKDMLGGSYPRAPSFFSWAVMVTLAGLRPNS